MPKGGKQVMVGPDGKGKWEADGSGVKTPDKPFKTQAKAQQVGRKALEQAGGGELTTRGRDGKIRAKDATMNSSALCLEFGVLAAKTR